MTDNLKVKASKAIDDAAWPSTKPMMMLALRFITPSKVLVRPRTKHRMMPKSLHTRQLLMPKSRHTKPDQN